MKKAQVQIGKVYAVKVSGTVQSVRLVQESPYGGWVGKNTRTGREVRVKTAAKLRHEVKPTAPKLPAIHGDEVKSIKNTGYYGDGNDDSPSKEEVTVLTPEVLNTIDDDRR